jgi:hypothetical protein
VDSQRTVTGTSFYECETEHCTDYWGFSYLLSENENKFYLASFSGEYHHEEKPTRNHLIY